MKKTVFTLLLVGLAGFWMMPSSASSHREAPLISMDPAADNTDVYAFRTPGDMVTLLSNFIPGQRPDDGPNFFVFDPNVVYAIHIDNNGDAVEDITFEWQFRTEIQNPATFLYNTGPMTTIDDPDYNRRQFYSLTRIDGPRRTGVRNVLSGRLPVPPVNVGPRSIPDYSLVFGGAINQVPADNMRIFAGQREEGFFVDLGVFDLLGVGSGEVVDGLRGLNVHTIAIEVPIRRLTRSGAVPSSAADPNAIIGLWSTASRFATETRTPGGQTHSGALVQVSRLGNPLVNEVVIDLARKDAFNGLEPTGDAVALDRVTDPEVPKLLKLIYGVDSPPAPRNDLVAIFLTGIPGANQPPGVRPAEMMRLNMAVPISSDPHPLGVLGGDLQGYPNGRRPGDDVVDITLRAAAGATPLTPQFNRAPNNTLGDGVDRNDVPYLTTFPYLATPHPGNR